MGSHMTLADSNYWGGYCVLVHLSVFWIDLKKTRIYLLISIQASMHKSSHLFKRNVHWLMSPPNNICTNVHTQSWKPTNKFLFMGVISAYLRQAARAFQRLHDPRKPFIFNKPMSLKILVETLWLKDSLDLIQYCVLKMSK